MIARARELSRALPAMLSVEMQATLQYRISNAVWGLTSLLQMVVYLSVWQAVAVARGGSAGGFTAPEFAGYFMALIIVRELTFTWVAWEIETLVNTGNLSPLLLRPVHPLLDQWVKMTSYKLQSVVMLAPLVIVCGLLFHATLDTSITRILITLMWLIPASMVRFCVDASVAMLAFWITRIGGPRSIYYALVLFLGGQFAPISVLPESLQQIARTLPFYWAAGYPVELATGSQPLSSLPTAVLTLGAWVIVSWMLLNILWRRGVTRYGAVGA